MPINVSIVEDDDGIRESLSVLLNGSDNIRCISTHRTAEEALKQVPAKKPDVVLMDINLPGMSGIDCVRKLRTALPKAQILMLTMYEDAGQIFNSLAAGANGYLLKRTSPAKLLEAIDEVHRGASPMSGKIARIVVEYFQTKKAQSSDEETLSKREREILELLAKGHRDKEIADVLTISVDTVHTHLKNIYEKLHVHSRTEAVLKYLGR